MQTAEIFWAACVFAFTAAGAACDVRMRKLPNVLTVPAFGLGLLFHIVNGFLQAGLSGTGHAVLFALGGFGTGFGILLVLWFVGGGGGGDVKFMGALGCWLGAWLTFQVLVLSALLSGAITIVILIGKVFRLQRLGGGQPDARTQRARKKKAGSAWSRLRSKESWIVPFGVPAALATWIVLALQLAGYGLQWPPIR
jgi:prepilin peptidase CpaA